MDTEQMRPDPNDQARNDQERTEAGLTPEGTESDDQKGGAGRPEDPARQEPEQDAIPDRYDLKAPEGMELDAALLEKASPLFRELRLTGDQAQKLSDLYADKLAETRRAQLDAWNGLLDGWRSAARADPEIGGSKFDENVGAARDALARFGTAELRKALDQYGMGNHPEMIRFCYRVARALSEDRLVDGRPVGGETDRARTLYPGMN